MEVLWIYKFRYKKLQYKNIIYNSLKNKHCNTKYVDLKFLYNSSLFFQYYIIKIIIYDIVANIIFITNKKKYIKYYNIYFC